MATHSRKVWTSGSPTAWKSHGQRSLVGCSPWGCRAGHDWATKHANTRVGFIGLGIYVIWVLSKRNTDSKYKIRYSALEELNAKDKPWSLGSFFWWFASDFLAPFRKPDISVFNWKFMSDCGNQGVKWLVSITKWIHLKHYKFQNFLI